MPTVLLTRPADLSSSLITKMRAQGFQVESLPMIEFNPVANQNQLIQDLQSHLPNADIAIFISNAAVRYGVENILKIYKTPPAIVYAAIGQATLRSLNDTLLSKYSKYSKYSTYSKHSNASIICPKMPPYESETLLAEPELQNVKDKKILIFKGPQGRELLEQTLKKRGAKIKIITCYDRQIPMASQNIAEKIQAWKKKPIHISVCTSSISLENLKTVLGDGGWPLLQNSPMIVVGLRMKALAATLGVSHIIVAKGADDASLLEALNRFKFFA